MSCNELERAGNSIVLTCATFQQVVINPAAAAELFYLGHYMERLSPSISAAGFFKINQSLLTTMISTIATYLIIYLQFYQS